MKIYLKWALPVLVLGVLSYLVWGFTTKLRHNEQAASRIQTLPAFVARNLDQSALTETALTNRPAVLVYFDPDCDHCQRETDALQEKAALLANAQVVLLSSAPLPALRAFASAHNLHNLPNIRVAQIDRLVAYETFNFTSVPDVLIYHANGLLAKRFKGETSVEAIARHL